MSNTKAGQLIFCRAFSITHNALLFKALNSTLKNTSPRKFERTEILKPVGQAKQPSATDGIDNRSLSQRKRDWLDNENRLKRKANLEKEFATSGMYDMYIFRKTGGKVFLSPKSYFKKEKSLYFPNFIADENLDKQKKLSTYNVFTNNGKKDKISIVRVYSTAVGQKFTHKYFGINSFSDPSLSANTEVPPSDNGNYLDSNDTYSKLVSNFPNTQIVNFSFYDNIIKKWVFKYFASKKVLQKSVNVHEYKKNFLILNNKFLSVPVKDDIHYLNGITGYIYVIDNEGKIRWLTSGEPTESDIQTLWKTVKGLEAEIKKKNNNSNFF